MQKTDISDILKARDERKEIIDAYSKNTYLVMIKANFPSIDKKGFYPTFVVNEIDKVINLKKIQTKLFADGLVHFYTSDSNFKEDAISIEEKHELGRYVDIDVFYNGVPIGRKDLGLKQRKCFLCEEDAKFCMRNQSHTQIELINKFSSDVDFYIGNKLKSFAKKSLLAELEIENKFGLVTPSSQGIHKDMDASMFLKSINVISNEIPKLIQVVKEKNNSQSYIDWGINTEKKMKEVTNGVNTHSGALFALGVYTIRFLNTLFYKEFEPGKFNESNEEIEKMFDKLEGKHDKSFKGALYWARDNYSLFTNIDEQLNSVQKLLKICTLIDDSTVIKRAGIEKYKQFQEMANSLVEHWSEAKYLELHDWSITNRISPGGAADLLSLLFFSNEIKREWNFII